MGHMHIRGPPRPRKARNRLQLALAGANARNRASPHPSASAVPRRRRGPGHPPDQRRAAVEGHCPIRMRGLSEPKTRGAVPLPSD